MSRVCFNGEGCPCTKYPHRGHRYEILHQPLLLGVPPLHQLVGSLPNVQGVCHQEPAFLLLDVGESPPPFLLVPVRERGGLLVLGLRLHRSAYPVLCFVPRTPDAMQGHKARVDAGARAYLAPSDENVERKIDDDGGDTVSVTIRDRRAPQSPSDAQRADERAVVQSLGECADLVELRMAACTLHATLESGNVSVVIAGSEAQLMERQREWGGRVVALADLPTPPRGDDAPPFAPQQQGAADVPAPVVQLTEAEHFQAFVRMLDPATATLQLHTLQHRGTLRCQCQCVDAAGAGAEARHAITVKKIRQGKPGRALRELQWPQTRQLWQQKLAETGATHVLLRLRARGALDLWGERRRAGQTLLESVAAVCGLQLPSFAVSPRTSSGKSETSKVIAFVVLPGAAGAGAGGVGGRGVEFVEEE